jgi:hypothetical protein
MLFRRPGKEPLSGGHISPVAQEKVGGSTLPIDGAIEVDPLATNLDISLIYGIADARMLDAYYSVTIVEYYFSKLFIISVLSSFSRLLFVIVRSM